MSEPFAGAAPGIAFIYSDESLAVHVREAIDAQVHIVYQASTGELDAQRLTATRVAAALVNLDSSSNADRLDQLAAVLDAAGVPVVFNDAEISRGLDGWARARWARHLLAKLRGSNDFYPPRPDAAAPRVRCRRGKSNRWSPTFRSWRLAPMKAPPRCRRWSMRGWPNWNRCPNPRPGKPRPGSARR